MAANPSMNVPQNTKRLGKTNPGSHELQFYQNDDALLDRLARIIGSALGSGNSGVVIATKAHRYDLERLLTVFGIDVSLVAKQGRYHALDASDTLGKFMVSGWPDSKRFIDVIGATIAQAKANARGEDALVAAFGEMVAVLWAEGKSEAALHLERLWDELTKTHSFQLHCAYPMSLFPREADTQSIQHICAQHSNLVPMEGYIGLTDEEERLRNIVFLQQRAHALDIQRQEAAEARRRLAAIVESSDDAIASKDLNGIVTSWNKSAERMFGYRADEIIGRPILVVIPPELHRDEDMILSKIRRGEKIDHFETVRVTKNGERIDVSLTISPVRDEQGKVIGAAKIVRNITENKKIERALRITERLATAGRLAATVAHEINNPLEAVTNLVYLAKRDLPDVTKAAQRLELASRELDRVAHIARQTLGFYRDSSSPVRLDVAQALDDLLSLYEKRLEVRNIKVIKQYEPKLEMTALAGEVRQAFSNLISNSIDAMPSGGSLVIRAAKSHEWYNSNLPGVRVSILDTGSGIEPRHRKNLFQPFFTTKADVGTGLGLWITRGIVEKHGGKIHVKTRTEPPNRGTVFSIFFPDKATAPNGISPSQSANHLMDEPISA